MRELTQWFDSVETDRPFEICKVCAQLLPLAADSWVVNKHYHRGECTLEYAVCEKCRDNVSSEFSDSSKATIRNFLENEIEWENRLLEWMALENSADRLSKCVACSCPRSSTQGFSISAQFRHDGSLIDGALPLMLCSDCIAEITKSLSPESRSVWQNFISQHFEGPDSEDIDMGIF
ncbi:MAG: hypothetical protein NWT08_14655 [Akkermansiaceae bacterium]|jgi:hypothetical protein|nr:hypothetical protein [Akkermansiaceae bacterium]MDP4646653.1 hypothetical protein [Akkermansiaceae bacterium]MDP4721137.1 hypothetical protein [Akkermansiaceae bacterium]MDP4779569.1 hypothetical protein [Akkermansiaceae bacterium]MDP4846351.1 hypothetical protein [Akkermansiaceae bacterium]